MRSLFSRARGTCYVVSELSCFMSESPHKRAVGENISIRKARSFCCQAICQNATPIVTYDVHLPWRRLPFVASSLAGVDLIQVDISLSHGNSELGKSFKDIVRVIQFEAIAATISGQIHCNERCMLLKFLRSQNIFPLDAAIGETMQENDKRFGRIDVGGIGTIGQIMEFEAISKSAKAMREASYEF